MKPGLRNGSDEIRKMIQMKLAMLPKGLLFNPYTNYITLGLVHMETESPTLKHNTEKRSLQSLTGPGYYAVDTRISI